MKPRPVDHLGPGEVGRHDGREALFDEHVDGEALERELEQRGLVLQVVELLARDACRALEVDEIPLVAQGEVVERREVERRRLALDEHGEVVFAASGTSAMHEVRHRAERGLEAGLRFAQALLDGGELVLEGAPACHVRFAFGVVHLALAGLLVLVALPVGLVLLGDERVHLLMQGDQRIEIDRDAPLAAALGDLVSTVL